MPLGPFLRRELLTSSRRSAVFRDRAVSVAVTTGIVAAVILTWNLKGWDRGSLAGMADFTRTTFGFLVAFQVAQTLAPLGTARRLAEERERRTLDAVLTTRLSDAQVVLGVIAASLVKPLTGLAAAFPIMALMALLGGIDPRLVLLAYAGLASLTFALAGVAVVASIGARNVRQAADATVGLWMAWWIVPSLVVLFLPRFWPGGAPWVMPIAVVMLDSSPLGVVLNLSGIVRRCGPLESVLRMFGLQAAGGVLLLLWAIVRLRPACRAACDGEGRTSRLRRALWVRRRPDCGDDPMLWKEMHGGSREMTVARLVDRLFVLALLGALVVATFWFARPAFFELVAHGYGAATGHDPSDEIHPVARLIVMGPSAGPPRGLARAEFNALLRQVTTTCDWFFVLALANLAASGVAAERARDTWSSLLATPLTGREILRAKMIGAVWRVRYWAAILVGLWATGLLVGAVHPLGFLAAVAGLAASSWFVAALGTYASLRSRTLGEATGRTSMPVLLLTFSWLLPILLPSGAASILMGAGSMPLQVCLSLVSYDDVHSALSTGRLVPLAPFGSRMVEGVASVLATWLIGLVGQALGAYLLTRAAIRGFDVAVGRPKSGSLVGWRSPTDASDDLGS
jgi:ABC-type Na+ efflux pump permease subunit